MQDQPKITQAMIDAYDEYTHLTLDRRAFMNKMTKLAGSGAAAAAIVPMLAANSARAAMVAEDDDRLSSEDITYPGDGGDMAGYLVRPTGAEGKLPAVIVIHENRGLNPHIRDVARRMALEGFVALAPDFLSPSGGTPEDEDKAREMIGQLDGGQTGGGYKEVRSIFAAKRMPKAGEMPMTDRSVVQEAIGMDHPALTLERPLRCGVSCCCCALSTSFAPPTAGNGCLRAQSVRRVAGVRAAGTAASAMWMVTGTTRSCGPASIITGRATPARAPAPRPRPGK